MICLDGELTMPYFLGVLDSIYKRTWYSYYSNYLAGNDTAIVF